MRVILKKSMVHFVNCYDFIGFYAAKNEAKKFSNNERFILTAVFACDTMYSVDTRSTVADDA